MKPNPRTADLFRITTDLLLMTTVVALASPPAHQIANILSTPLESRSEKTRITGPGRGQVATITLKDADAIVEVGGKPLQLDAFLKGNGSAGSVVLKLN